MRILIDGKNYTRKLQLPVSVQLRKDGGYDTAVLTLNFMRRGKPFKPFTKVELIEDARTLGFVIDADKVSECALGDTNYFKHELTLIEITKLLERNIMPDIAITQPLTSFTYPKAIPSITDNGYNRVLNSWKGGDVGTGLEVETKFELRISTTTNIKEKYLVGAAINVSAAISARVYKIIKINGNIDSRTLFYEHKPALTIIYRAGTSGAWGDIPENWTPSVGTYQIRLFKDVVKVKYEELTFLGFGTRVVTSDKTVNHSEIYTIEVAASGGDEYSYTVDEAITKVIDNYYLPRHGEALPADYIHLDEAIILSQKLNTLRCPEMTQTGGRTMYEVLSDIGAEFSGYPRLLDEHTLTFDVLMDIDYSVAFNSIFYQEATSDSYASGFRTDLKNATTTEVTKVYPRPGMWARVAVDPSENVMTEQNICILLPSNIHMLRKVEVSNFNSAYPDESVDITVYVKEKTIYETLNKNADGAGMAIFYTRGSNKIEGLGMLPNMRDLLGLQPTDTIIERIINYESAYGVAGRNPVEFLFRVEYAEQTSGQVQVIKSDMRDFGKVVNLPYKQDTPNVSSELFGRLAQTKLKQIGNHDLYAETLSATPLRVGSHIVYNGDKYYLNVINEEIYNGYRKISAQFTKDYNKIDSRIGVDKRYREYEIYADEFVRRAVHLNYFYCVCKDSDSLQPAGSYPNNVMDVLLALRQGLLERFSRGKSYPPFNFVTVQMLDKDGAKIKYTKFNEAGKTTVPALQLSLSMQSLGKTVNFIGKTFDNYSVGQKLEKTDSIFEFSKAINTDVRYVDDKGEVYGAQLEFSFHYDVDTYPATNDVLGDDEIIILKKDNREALDIVLGYHAVAIDGGIVGNGLLRYMFLNEAIDVGDAILVGYNGDLSNKETLEYTQADIHGEIILVSIPWGWEFKGVFEPNKTITKDYDGLALVWENTSEIIIADNIKREAGDIPAFSMFIQARNSL